MYQKKLNGSLDMYYYETKCVIKNLNFFNLKYINQLNVSLKYIMKLKCVKKTNLCVITNVSLFNLTTQCVPQKQIYETL
jgi:hypothetical protein